MAGTDSGFDATAFTNAVKFAMTMGTPVKPAERATFQWPVRREFTSPDSGNRPYNWTSTPLVEDTHPDVQVLCAVEFFSGPTDGTSIGNFETARAVITLLDQEYEKVKGASRVLLGGNKYEISFTAPPIALFSVGVYNLHCVAINES